MVTVEKIPRGSSFQYHWTGTSGADVIQGYSRQFNQLFGLEGNDHLTVGRMTTSNVLYGGEGDDTLVGGHGRDNFRPGPGADLMMGGPGDDTYVVDNIGDVIVEKARWGVDSGGGGDRVWSSIESFSLEGLAVEQLFLDAGGRIGIGNNLPNKIMGNVGDNILDGGRGVDRLDGNGGNDTYLLRTPGDSIDIRDFFGDNDVVWAFGSFKLAYGVENIIIQDMIGKTGSPVQGLTAVGNQWHNEITGNAYDNNLNGLGGADTLTGGTGDDTFIFATDFHPNHIDTITDFGVGDDRLLFKRALTDLPSGMLDADAFHLGSEATTADHRFTFDGTTLRYDADGSGAGLAVDVAVFDGSPTLIADDIFIS